MLLFFWILSKWGGGGPCLNFLSSFHKCFFGQWKESISSKMQIIWTLDCFLCCIYVMYYIVYIVFLVLNWLPNLEFWRQKKVVQVVQVGERKGCNLDKIQKKSSFLVLESVSVSVLVLLVLNWLSNLEFWRPNKKDQVARIGVRGGGWLVDSGNTRKKTFFLIDVFP